METLRKDRGKASAGKLQQGFTLIELVIVLAVLGALASIAVPQLTGLQGEARIAGTAVTVSSELNGAFAKAMASGNLDGNNGGVDWKSNLCARSGDDVSLEEASPTLKETDYNITGLLTNGTGSAENVDMKTEVTVPRYDDDSGQTSEVGKGNVTEKICYLTITNS